MNTSNTLITQMTLPGIKPIFDEFEIDKNLDPQDSFFLDKIWRFYNKEQDSKSLINRVEIWKDHTKIALVHIFFHTSGCKEMQEVYASLTPTFDHHHDYHWCLMEISKPENIRTFLFSLTQSSEFSEGAQTEMSIISQELSEKISHLQEENSDHFKDIAKSFFPSSIIHLDESKIDINKLSKKEIEVKVKNSDMFGQEIILLKLLLAGKDKEKTEERNKQALAAELYLKISPEAQRDFLLRLLDFRTILKDFAEAIFANEFYHDTIGPKCYDFSQEQLAQEKFLLLKLQNLLK